jgi:hypothetical protein
MTAPGQEPDEILTAKPQGAEHDDPRLDDIGDNHMPDDLREAQRAEGAESSDETDTDAD